MFLADVFDLTQDDRTQKIRFAGNHDSIRCYAVDGKLAYDGFEFMRRSEYLYAGNSAATQGSRAADGTA